MFGKIQMVIVFVLIVSLLSIGSVSASTSNDSGVHVALNGSDSGNGSSDNPYLTVGKAINSFQSGSTIYMSRGNYSSMGNTNLTIDKSLTIYGSESGVVFNGGNNSYFFNVTQNGILTLVGIDFSKANTLNSNLIAPILNYGTLNIVNCSFTDNLGLRSGVLLNYGTLNIYNSTFINNQGNYTGTISNVGISSIFNSNFKNNRVTDKNYNFNNGTNGSAVYNIGNLDVHSSEFLNNSIFSRNSGSGLSLTNISFSSFRDNSILYIENSTGFVASSYFGGLINVTKTGNLTINYSVISSYDFSNSTVSANYNWWGNNEKIPPSFVDKWLILTFTSNGNNVIPSKTNSTVNLSFKLKDFQGIHDVPANEALPKCFVRLIADNGNFTNPEGYLIDNSFSSVYYNNTIDTVIYANVADYYIKLIVGTGLSNQRIYVSNSGSDDNDGSLSSPLKSLSKAINISLNGAIIYVLSGSYFGDLNSNLLIAKNLTVTSYGGLVTFLRGNNIIFKVASYGQLNLDGVTFTASDPNVFVPIINSTGVLFINNCTIENLRGGDRNYYIGGRFMYNYYQNQSIIFTSGPLFINNTIFSNLTEFVIKSSILLNSHDYIPVNITILNSTFKNLSGIPRSVILGPDPYPAYSLYLDGDYIRIDNCSFFDNNVTPIKTHTRYSTVITSSLFDNNDGVMDNGNHMDEVEMDYGNNSIINSIFIENNSPLRSYFTGYTSPLIEGVQNFINCTFENNKIVLINTWYSHADNISIYGCYFVNNTNSLGSQSQSDYWIEGIILNGGNLTVDYSVFENNNAYYGGAIVNDDGGVFYINHSVFVNNMANIGKDILNKNGYGYISNTWWGSNSGPTEDKVFSSIGEVYIENWVILTLKTNGTSATASLGKVTDQDGNIYDIDGVLPSREVTFEGKSVGSPLRLNLIDNEAFIDLNITGDLDVNATVDNQTVNLAVHSKDTIIDIDNVIFYGKNNVYNFILRNINGYLITNQTIKFIITNQKGIVGNYTVITDKNGKGQIIINNSIGNYNIQVLYNGDGYFNPTTANATMQIKPYYTDIFVINNQTFYGKNNIFYITLYDNTGTIISGELIKFIVTGNGKNITYSSITDGNGQGSFIVNLPKGSYIVKTVFEGDDWHFATNSTTTFEVAPIGTNVELGFDHLYGRGNPYTIELTDDNGNVLVGENIILTISQGNKSSSYNLTTNDYGIAGLIINLSPGNYNVTAKFAGDGLNLGNTTKGTLLIEKVGTKLSTDPVLTFDNKNSILKVKLTDIYGRPLSGEFVNITISNLDYNKTYKILTDNNGTASLAVNVPTGNYLVVTNFLENAWYGSTFTGSTLIVNDIDQTQATKISFKNNNGTFLITLTDTNGKAIANKVITLNIVHDDLNSTLSNITDSKGVAKFSPTLDIASYNIFYIFSGDGSYLGSTGFIQLEILPNSISTALTIPNVSMKYGDKKNLTVKLTDANGKILTGKTLTLSVKGSGFSHVYYFTTNSAGMISVPINLGVGNYTVKVTYTADGVYKSSTASGTIKVVKTDNTSPKISKIDPVNGATKVAPSKTIKVTFSETIKAGSKVWVELKNSSGKAIAFKYSISGKVLTIDPKSNLAESLYTLVIHTGAVTDLAGNKFALKSTKFSVGTAPKVSKIDPANSATKVARSKTIKVTFNEAIKAGSKVWVELKNSSNKAVAFKYSINGKVLTIDPKSNLAESLYTLIIHTGAVTDLAGNPVASKSYKFSVGTAPKVSKVDPRNGVTKVSRSKTIKVTFNENIKAASGSKYWVELKTSSGKSVKISKSISGKVLSITPAKLAVNTKYQLIIHGGAVTDKAGNPVAAKTYKFTTGNS